MKKGIYILCCIGFMYWFSVHNGILCKANSVIHQTSQIIQKEETIVKVAEYSNARNNPEIVSPKDMLENTFRNVLNEQDFGGDRYDRLVINYMGKNVLNESTEYIREQEKIRGVSIVKGGAY